MSGRKRIASWISGVSSVRFMIWLILEGYVGQASEVGVVSHLAPVHEFLHVDGQPHQAGDARDGAHRWCGFLGRHHLLPGPVPLAEVFVSR